MTRTGFIKFAIQHFDTLLSFDRSDRMVNKLFMPTTSWRSKTGQRISVDTIRKALIYCGIFFQLSILETPENALSIISVSPVSCIKVPTDPTSQAAQSRQPCVNSHQLSQWEALGTVIFDPHKINRHTLTDRYKICHRWLRPWPLQRCKIPWKSVHGGLRGK